MKSNRSRAPTGLQSGAVLSYPVVVIFGRGYHPSADPQPDYQTSRNYWNKLKERLGKEGNQSVTSCHRLKLPAADESNSIDRSQFLINRCDLL